MRAMWMAVLACLLLAAAWGQGEAPAEGGDGGSSGPGGPPPPPSPETLRAKQTVDQVVDTFDRQLFYLRSHFIGSLLKVGDTCGCSLIPPDFSQARAQAAAAVAAGQGQGEAQGQGQAAAQGQGDKESDSRPAV